MSESPPDSADTSNPAGEPEFYYAVLNLPTTATDHEIRDRYRQLSMLFHPDRQRDKDTESTAVKHFLEVQKAYEVLSDPVTRQAYDSFGLEGVRLVTSPRSDWDGKSQAEVQSELLRKKAEADNLRLQRFVSSKGQITMNIAALRPPVDTEDAWYTGFWGRVRNFQPIAYGLSHSVTVPVSDRTKITLSGESSLDNGNSDASSAVFGKGLVGTVRHQYSPRLSFQASTSLLAARNLRLKSKYDAENTEADVQVFFSPALINAFFLQGNKFMRLVPPTTSTISRRLFPGSNLWGRFTVSTLPLLPQFQLELTSSRRFDRLREDLEGVGSTDDHDGMRPPSRTGFDTGVTFWDVGLALSGWLPSVVGQFGLHFAESGIRLKAGVNLGLLVKKMSVGASWHGDNPAGSNNVGVDVGIGTDGVGLSLDMTYLNQRFYLPIILSTEYDDSAAFWTVVVPTATLVLTHHFFLKPRRRKARIQFFRQARRELREAKSDVVRQAEETRLLLRETAQRHMEAEASADGLVIVDARYGPAENDDALEGLTVDVTIPVQALVNKSQLYIPGRRSKAGLQGFYDPVPSAPKSLRVRYTFRGRPHYAEIPDFMPVVLPLEEHCVD